MMENSREKIQGKCRVKNLIKKFRKKVGKKLEIKGEKKKQEKRREIFFPKFFPTLYLTFFSIIFDYFSSFSPRFSRVFLEVFANSLSTVSRQFFDYFPFDFSDVFPIFSPTSFPGSSLYLQRKDPGCGWSRDQGGKPKPQGGLLLDKFCRQYNTYYLGEV